MLIQAIHVFTEDIGMEFAVEKYATLVMKKGNSVKTVSIEPPLDSESKVI